MTVRAPQLDVVLPVHNEAATIEATVREWQDALGARLSARLVVCEDGSTDGSHEILSRLASDGVLDLVSDRTRKGYSQAVIDGLRATRAPFVLVVDGDGQCNPGDLQAFWDRRHDAAVVVGVRRPRIDPVARRVLSRAARVLFRAAFGSRVSDPSCPFVLIARPALERLLPALGVFPEGFWWEVSARAHHLGVPVTEVPIRHRARSAGGTKVYTWTALPRIGWAHVRAGVALWRELRR
ncbi:MAG: glycosyltransferase family 2 protein [Acidimicrobiia bacterium]|nr:glycosyltransferase family 2 protein [Acidimicrobiia bacterium]